ncbi:tol-pal system YbgF family protein [Arundinibacter roseus]|uniref:Uncharacterized protein n=1 Tax=Arundinibacter roseus TaxID=2070510 RepID=A0A4R4JXZ3_9BACT|nr:hypothetical protein [Arundinibacter roseus]TDB59563.1 hypothetical protein EZE20_22455 [Arundinibacter roseus]
MYKYQICFILNLILFVTSGQLKAKDSIGETLYYQRKFKDATSYFRVESIKGDKNNKAHNIFWLGQCLAALRQPDSAIVAYEYLVAEKNIAPIWKINALGGLASIYSYRQDTKKVEFYVSQMLLYGNQYPEKRDARYWRIMGNFYFDTYKNDLATTHFIRSANTAESQKDSIGLVGSYVMLGRVYERLEKNIQALHYFELAIKMQDELKINLHLPQCYQSVAALYENQNNFKKAFEYYSKGISLDTKLGDNYGRAYGLIGVSNALLNQGKTKNVASLIGEAYSIFIKYDDQPCIGYCLNLKGLYHQKNSNIKKH